MIRRHALSDEDSERIAKELEISSSGHGKKVSAEKPESAFAPEPEKDSGTAGEEAFVSEAAPGTEQIPQSALSGAETSVGSAGQKETVREYVPFPDGTGSPEDNASAEPDLIPEESFEEETEDEYVAHEFVNTLRKTKEKKRRTLRKSRKVMIRRVLLLVSIVAFLVSIYMITKEVFSGMEAKRLYDDLQENFSESLTRNGNTVSPSTRMVTDVPTPPYGSDRLELDSSVRIPTKSNADFKKQQAKLASFKIENPDTYGWIKVDGTNINYIVVKGWDNVYYLDHTYAKFYNPLGTIFADFRNGDNMLDNYNTVFYGHNATYQNQMFNQLTNLLSRDSFNANRYITVYTTYGILTYEIFSIYETDIAFQYYRIYFNNGYSFISWANAVRDQSLFVREGMAPFTASDRILTLSTCTNGVNTRRYAVHARLVSIEVD